MPCRPEAASYVSLHTATLEAELCQAARLRSDNQQSRMPHGAGVAVAEQTQKRWPELRGREADAWSREDPIGAPAADSRATSGPLDGISFKGKSRR
jgi:hypothetical protein